MRLPRISGMIVVLAVALALAASGCTQGAQRANAPSDSSGAPASAIAPPSATSDAAESAAQPDDELAVGSVPIDAAEAQKLEQELIAIERELESLDMPSDSDFEGIEGSL